MSAESNILVRLKDAGIRQNDKWLVKGVSLEVNKDSIDNINGNFLMFFIIVIF